MKWSQLLHFVTVAVATTLLCSIPPAFSFPYGDMKTIKHKLMLDMKDSTKDQDRLEKLRDPRETMPESLVVSEVSTTYPPDVGNEGKGVTTMSQDMLCNQESHVPRKFKSCKTLQEALTEHFIRPSQAQKLDTSYNAFTLADLFYSGLLEGRLNNDKLPTMQHRINRGKEVCDSLLKDWLKPQNVSSGHCSWHYKCTYNPDEFPSFKVEAEIDNPEFLDTDRCRKVSMSSVTVFQKQICQADPCRLTENWVEVNHQSIAVSFTADVL